MVENKVDIIEREYIIPLRSGWKRVPRYKRANKAIKTIKEFLVRHMKIRDRDLNKVRIDKRLNELIWLRGIKKPPVKVKVKVKKEGEILRVESIELPDRIKFKKIRGEKVDKQAKEAVEKKKTLLEKAKASQQKSKEEPSEEKVEENKQEQKKKSAVVEAGKNIEKAAAKQSKHVSSAKMKEPKHQQRKALAK